MQLAPFCSKEGTMRFEKAILLALLAAPCAALHAPTMRAPAHGPLQQVQGSAASLARPTEQSFSADALRLKGGGKAVEAAPKPWYSAFWNEQVELLVLFGAWYWGNIYCEGPHAHPGAQGTCRILGAGRGSLCGAGCRLAMFPRPLLPPSRYLRKIAPRRALAAARRDSRAAWVQMRKGCC